MRWEEGLVKQDRRTVDYSQISFVNDRVEVVAIQ